jgi:exodeoxyribonuclease VII large subunit
VRPGQQVAVQRMRLHGLQQALKQSALRKIEQNNVYIKAIEVNLSSKINQERALRKSLLDGMAGRLAAMDPALVLKRGYAWLQTDQGIALTRTADARPGDHLTAYLADGEVALSVR